MPVLQQPLPSSRASIPGGPPKPFLELTTAQATFDLGTAVTLQYALVGAESIAVKPIVFCAVGESDFKISFQVRDASGAVLPYPDSGMSNVTLKKDWLAPPRRRPLILNDAVPLPRPGNYTVVATLHVLRPAGKITAIRSEPLTITLTDSDAQRARREAAVRHATRLFRDADAPAGERTTAIRALRYLDDPAALPTLTRALNDPHLAVVEQAEQILLLWPDAAAAERAAHLGLAEAADRRHSVYTDKWQGLLAGLELRRRFGASPWPGEVLAPVNERATQVVIKTLLASLSHLPVGLRAERRIDLILFQEKTPDAGTLRPVLATAARMSRGGQERLEWILSTWDKRPSRASLRPLRAELERLAANPILHPPLRSTVRQAL